MVQIIPLNPVQYHQGFRGIVEGKENIMMDINTGLEQLKPCLFCGGKAYFRITSTGSHVETRKIGFQIECRSCRVSIPKTCELEVRMNENGGIETLLDEREKAVQTWNNRV